ncbi:hypothetical protein DVH05_022311 [Phytophthora capsici]|nr:hypothetical protein DVH05_022311 [Phytophthora capsici]
MRDIAQEKDILSAQSKENKLRDPEDTKMQEFEQEIRLLRSEKLRMEENHRQEVEKLEARVANSEAQHRQLVTKYQERFEFDPLEAKRAAMAVKTMQNTLQNVVLEKEELGIRYGELKEKYCKFYNEQTGIVEKLKKELKNFEKKKLRMGQQRILSAFENWTVNTVRNAWRKWVALMEEKRLQEQHEMMKINFEREVDDRVAKIQDNQAVLLALKLLQQSTRRNFLQWRFLTRKNVERRRKGEKLTQERSWKSVQRVMNCWKAKTQQVKDRRAGVLKIKHLLVYRSRLWGFRKWSLQSFRLALEEKDQKLRVLKETMDIQTQRIVNLEKALSESRKSKQELQARHDDEMAAFTENVERQKAAELAVRQKLGRFFTKQSDRQLLKEITREWKLMAHYLLGLRQRTDLIRTKLRVLKLQRSVNTWHSKAHQNHKKRLQMQHILERLRHLGVLKCFNSWKERVSEAKARKKALLYAVNRIRNRGVARCFTQWREFRQQRISLRNALEVIRYLTIKQQTFFWFSSWKERVTEMKIAAQVQHQQLIQRAWENRLEQAKKDLNFQRECFTRWYELVLHRKRQIVVVKKCLVRMRNGSLARVLGSWREFIEMRKTQRGLVRRWVARCHSAVLQQAWKRWQRQIVAKEHQLLIIRLQEERRMELKLLETELELCRNTQQNLIEEAGQVQKEQEKKLTETATRLQKEERRAVRLTGAVDALCLTRARDSTLARCLKSWQKIVRRSICNRQSAAAFLFNLNTRRICTLLGKWRHFTMQKKRLRAVFITLQSCFSRWWQIQCLKAWISARRKSLAVQVFSNLFLRCSETNLSREVLVEWRKIARKNHLLRKTLEKIWLRSVHAKLRQQFKHWLEFTKAEAAKEQLERRNVALTAIRAKIWWKQSVSIMRFCFSEWKDTVKARKNKHLAERKLIFFQRSRLAKVIFSAWAEFVVAKRQELDRNQGFGRWLRKIRLRKQQHAMTQWKLVFIRDQQRDLEQLKLLQNAQQEKLQLQKEEIASLLLAVREAKRKLDDATEVHDESTSKVQLLTEFGLMAKYFNALKLYISVSRHQTQAVHFCQKTIRRRYLAQIISNWQSFVQNRRQIKLAVVQRMSRCQDTQNRAILRHWQKTARHQRTIKQKQKKLQQRLRERVINNVFTGWRRAIYREREIISAVGRLELLARRLQLENALLSWKQKCIAEKNRALQEQDKHRKIAQFLMGRQEAGLVRMFHLWKAFTKTKTAPRVLAMRRFDEKCRFVLAKCWRNWHFAVKIGKQKRESVECLQVLLQRFFYRVAFSRWRRYRFMSQIAILQSGNDALSCQIAESNRLLESKTMSIDQLSTELMELRDKLFEAESRASTVGEAVVSQEAIRTRQLSCWSALSKIMIKRTISRDISEAFTLWKIRVFEIRRKHRALSTVANIRKRRRRLFAFWLWKVKTLRYRQLETLKKLWGRSDLLIILQRWKVNSSTRVKLRLFLTKRCLLSSLNRSLPVFIAFRLWKTKSMEISALEQVTKLDAKLRFERISATNHLRRLNLGKWCWIAYHHRLRQMRTFLSRCYAHSTRKNSIKHRHLIEEMQLKSDEALVKVKEQIEARAREEVGAMSAVEEQWSTGVSFQALQTLTRRLFQPTTVKDLFVGVSSTFAQILHGSTAVLFLFDPSSNELWTQREENQLIQVPASLGIAGSTLSSGSTMFISDVASDPRFHPMVDQFSMNNSRDSSSVKSTVDMVSTALVSSDGAVYGILQVAFSTTTLSPVDRRILVARAQLYSKTCCFYVEQLVFEMLRNTRDRVRARTPDTFIKLFKQNKSWRKYYALIERKATDLERKLQDVLEDREQLIQTKNELQERHRQVQDRLNSKEQNTKDVSKLVTDWKKKLVKWQKVIEEKDQAIDEKTHELEQMRREFEHYRRDRRSKELQNVLTQHKPSSISSHDEESSLSDRGQLSILRADQTRLKSQLVRAEADNLLLVKAISIARTQHGELPRTIQTEVTRVATRVSRRPSEE